MSLSSFLKIFKTKDQETSTKAIPINNYTSGLQIVFGDKPVQDLSPTALIALNKGWVSICNSKNSSTLASIPIKLYYHSKTGTEPSITAYKRLSIKKQTKVANSLNIELKSSENITEITEHQILDLFSNINETYNYFDWCELNFEYLGLIGNSYNEIIYQNNIPIALNPLLSEYVTPVATGHNQGRILYYMYRPETGKEIKYMPDQILHFAQYAPGNLLVGKGDLENCISAQERYLFSDAYEKYLGLNNSRPDFAVNFKNKLSEKDMKDIYRQINKRFGNVQNAGKVMVISGEMDIKTLGFSPRDLQTAVSRQWSLKEICGGFGVPEALVSTTDVNRANAVESMNHYLRNTIYPKMVKYLSKINEQLTPKYDSNLYVWFEEQYLENPVEKVQNTISAYSAGIIDKNEARSNLGYEPVNDVGSDEEENK